MKAAPSLQALLDHEQESLDRLMSEIRGGIRGPEHFDELEERAAAIRQGIRAAFRTWKGRPS